MLPLLRESNAGYIGFSLTGRGVLADDAVTREDFSQGDLRRMDAVFAGERHKSALRVRDELSRVGRDFGAGPVQMAIAWALAQEGVVTGLVGPSTQLHLEEDVEAAGLRLEESLLIHLASFLGREEENLRRALKTEIITILGSEITNLNEGASSLIYAFEGLSELNLATDEELVSRIGLVLKIMKGGEGDLSSLESIRKDLLSHVSASP
jgi:hypothetical protein